VNFVLDENGNPKPCASIVAWGKWFEDIDSRRVCLTDIASCMVSTVFLGVDHGFGDGPPILWESMVFEDGSALEDYTNRYTSKEDAVKGHNEIVSRLEREFQP